MRSSQELFPVSKSKVLEKVDLFYFQADPIHPFFIKNAIVFKIKINHGNPCKRRSNQSKGFIKFPSISIDNFSITCGGENGASPSVAHNTMIIPQFNRSTKDNIFFMLLNFEIERYCKKVKISSIEILF